MKLLKAAWTLLAGLGVLLAAGPGVLLAAGPGVLLAAGPGVLLAAGPGVQLAAAAPSDVPAGSSSTLAKYVLAFSRPGAFKQLQQVFGEDPRPTTSCPPGEEGLACRQQEARRVQDYCPGGDCEACQGCNRTTLWPRCCQQSGLCCSQLARSCQLCEPADLRGFCAKNFKRCF